MAIQQPIGQFVTEGISQVLAVVLAGPLVGAKLKLFQQGFAPGRNNVAADFATHEATFTGYAAGVLTWSAIGLDASGAPTVLSSRVAFQATDALNPNVIAGAWLEQEVTGPPAGAFVLQWYPFAPAINMNTALASFGVVLAVQSPGGPGYASVDY